MAIARPPARRSAPSTRGSRALGQPSHARGARPNHVLTPRDDDILHWIGRYGVVSTEQVARRWFPRKATTRGPWTTTAAYRRVRILEELGLLQRDQIYLRGPHILRLTQKGARAVEKGVRPATLVPARVDHSLAVVDLTEELLARFPEAMLITEREIRRDQIKARRATAGQADHVDQHAPILKRVPDAMLLIPSRGTIAIELDYTAKTTKDVEQIAHSYFAGFLTIFHEVWWYAPRGRVAKRVREMILALGFSNFITVEDWPVEPRRGESA